MEKLALRSQIDVTPKSPGVYRWLSSKGEVIYVGKANSLRERLLSHYNSPEGSKSARICQEASAIDYIAVTNEKEALVLEQTLIKRHKPKFNVRLTDGRGYPYLKLTREKYPRLLKVHEYGDDGATYFGPFPDGYAAFHVVQVLLDTFPLRRCKTLPTVKCLYYDIGKCAAPCINACTDDEYQAIVTELKGVLRGDVKQLLGAIQTNMESAAAKGEFERAKELRDQLLGLRGVLERQHVLVDRIEDRDIVAIAREGARAVGVLLHIRDGKIVGQEAYTLETSLDDSAATIQHQFILSHYQDRPVPATILVGVEASPGLSSELRLLADQNVSLQVPQRGDGVRWLQIAATNATLRLQEEIAHRLKRGVGGLEALQVRLGLPELPTRIEGFDISHSVGRFTRAAMVVFVDGEPKNSAYRTFKMRQVGESAVGAGTAPTSRGKGREIDDFASIHEAVSRRLQANHMADWGEPKLLVIDGGLGQLHAAMRALQENGLEHIPICSLAKQEELVYLPNRVHPLRLEKSDAALQLLQRVRDESHRFGIQQVRSHATRAVIDSPLDLVDGLGPKRRAILMKQLNGLQGVRHATLEELLAVPGVGPSLAQKIFDAVRS